MSKNIYVNGAFVMPTDTELSPELLAEYIKKHKELMPRYERLKKLYVGQHLILDADQKASYKPDNRLVVNFAKYIVDTLNGYFIGIPIKLECDSEQVSQYLEFLDAYNDQDDNNAELSKICSVYGHAYELLYTDAEGEICLSYVDPMQCFIIYDDSIMQRPMYGVRYYKDTEDIERGSFSNSANVTYFHNEGSFLIDNTEPHYFGDVPLIEYMENEERQSVFEPVETLINAYNKALSEKANDVDYYADAYLSILGAKLDDKTLTTLRDSRIINLEGDTDKVLVQFLQKPDADGTQENLIERMERLIFQISMVANISDKDFGNASGVSLKYKLQPMSDLAKTKERKFVSGMNRRYKMVSRCPASKMQEEDWMTIKYHFTRNIPNNLFEESQIAGNLAGITSEETQLKVLSIVDDVKAEMKRKDKEAENAGDTFSRIGGMDSEQSGILGEASEAAMEPA